MKVGVVSNALLQFPFEEGLDFLVGLGLERVEVACGGYHRNRAYGDAVTLAADASARERWLDAIRSRGLVISALAVHGPAMSPDRAVAEESDRDFRAACELGAQIGVDRLTVLGGLPEGAPGDRCGHWVVNAWPPQEQEILKWQWEQRVIPYWSEQARIAQAHGCRICVEIHPNTVTYNPSSFLRLRGEVGETIGCNFDPSHLFWMGIDPLEALRVIARAGAVYHVHAKDTKVLEHVVRLDGVLDPKPFSQLDERAWDFRTVGYGHGEPFWRDMVSILRAHGYDDVLSIEHEDDYMDPREGLEKAVALLKPLVLERPAVSSWNLTGDE
ncbi:MAG TPA: sugar phosphate isomerase/epimerase, partial [Conexibacter sp.]|jgi:sugar phosphate isomerase/epimerase|nr:sugar phosphate isomerase/epimerase [Conexibacter sp.]